MEHLRCSTVHDVEDFTEGKTSIFESGDGSACGVGVRVGVSWAWSWVPCAAASTVVQQLVPFLSVRVAGFDSSVPLIACVCQSDPL